MEQQFTKLCIVLLAILLFSCIHQHQCRELYGYKFPVFSTLNCPRNKIEWNVRSSALNCTENNGYTCLPNENFTELLEFCYIQPLILIQEGLCLYLVKRFSLVNGYNCSKFRYGCPKSSYLSTNISEYPSCITIGNGCFLAEPFCTSASTHPYPTTTFTTFTHSTNDHVWTWVSSIVGVCSSICAFCSTVCMLRIYYKKNDCLFCKGQNDEESQLEERVPLTSNEKEYNKNSFKKESPLERKLFDSWQKEEINFIQTKACVEVEDRTKQINLIIVAGHSGSGKSAIIQHVALKYRCQGWKVKPFKDLNGLIDTILSRKKLKNKTLFLIDDPFGKESLDDISYDLWVKNQDAIKSTLKMVKLLMTCRTSVLSAPRKELFTKSSIVEIDSDQYKLTEEEKRNILNVYTSDINLSEKDIFEIVQTETYFPLLCKLFASNEENVKDGIRFFKEPIEVFMKEIRSYRETNSIKYCALVLVVFFNNKLRMDDFFENETSVKKYEYALKLFGIKDKAAYYFHDILDSLKGFIVKKNDETFQFYHDFLMDVTTFVFGTDYPRAMIKYGEVGFLRRRVRLKNDRNNNDQFTIYLSDNSDIQQLGKRLYTDIFSENLLDVVLNPCLRNKEVYQVVMEEIKHHPEKLDKLLKKRKINTLEHKYDWTMKNAFMTNVTFVGLEIQVSSLFALIVFCHTELSEYCLRTLENAHPNCIDSFLFFAVCSNGSKILWNMFEEDSIKEYLNENFENLYPIHILSVFHRSDLLHEVLKFDFEINLDLETNDENGWTPLILAASNVPEESTYNQENPNESLQEKTMHILISKGANINLCAKNGFNPLFVACKNGNNSAVQFLLKRGAEIDYQCEIDYQLTIKRIPPLYIACLENHDDTAQILLYHGANVDLCTQNGVSLLYNACQEGHDNVVQFLIKSGADINLCKEDGTSPLYAACHNGHVSTMLLLLSEGALIDLRNKNGESPLYTASEYGFNDNVKHLLSKKSDINLCKKNGESPLFVACKNGQENVVRSLLEHNVLYNQTYINLCRNDGCSPLCIASLNGHIKTVQLLLEKGADINLYTDFNESPLYAASVSGNYKIVELLLKCGADINYCTKNGESPLYVACQCIMERSEAVNDDNGSDMNISREKGDSCSDKAYQKDYKSIVKLLLCHGADITLYKEDGTSPVYAACKTGHDSIVQLLLSKGANIDFCKKNGESPLYTACAYGFESIVQNLLDNHANVNLLRENGESPLYAALENEHECVVRLLLNNNVLGNRVDVDQCSEDGTSPLILASLKGRVQIVESLLLLGADVNLCKEDGTSPLYVACQTGHDSTVKLLLRKNANIDSCKRNGESSLYISSAHGFKNIVQQLLDSHASVNLQRENGESPVYKASAHGFDSIVKLLLNSKADVNLYKKNGESPLFVACKNGHERVVRLLLKHDGLNNNRNINLRTNDGFTPLCIASLNGYIKNVQLLLKKRADINLCTNFNESPLYAASVSGNYGIVELLLKWGAAVNLCNEEGESPLYVACQCLLDRCEAVNDENDLDVNTFRENRDSFRYTAFQRDYESTVQTLTKYEANINLCKKNGESALYIACAHGFESIVQHLLKNNANVNLLRENGESALYAACENGHENVVQLLLNDDILDNKADVNLCNEDGTSPLILACRKGHFQIVKLLLNHEADVNICKKDGTSSLFAACQNGHESIVNLLLSNKANIDLCKKNGETPLYIACAHGFESIVQHLLNNHANVNLLRENRESPLFAACENGHECVVQLLLNYDILDNKADVNLCSEDGTSPLCIARQKGYDEIVQHLLSHGGK